VPTLILYFVSIFTNSIGSNLSSAILFEHHFFIILGLAVSNGKTNSLNPTYTIVQLSLRLADNIIKEIKKNSTKKESPKAEAA